MQEKVLVLDIDGTLTNSKKEITEATKQGIWNILQHGHKVILASGRPTAKYESHHHPHYRSFDIQFLFSCILQNINKIPLLLSSKHGIYILSDSYFTIYFSSLSRGCASEITFRYVTSAEPLTVICTLFTV